MPLPDPVSRQPVHTRRIQFEAFRRDDGLWDLDCELLDTKSQPMQLEERGLMPAGQPIHQLRVRLTVDDTLTIRAVQTAADAAPFGECQQPAGAPMQKLVGLTMGRGWRNAINEALGGVKGCTHLRELVYNAATAAFQTIPVYQAQQLKQQGVKLADLQQPPFFMGQCMSWAFEGAVVKRYAPQFWRAPQTDDAPKAA